MSWFICDISSEDEKLEMKQVANKNIWLKTNEGTKKFESMNLHILLTSEAFQRIIQKQWTLRMNFKKELEFFLDENGNSDLRMISTQQYYDIELGNLQYDKHWSRNYPFLLFHFRPYSA